MPSVKIPVNVAVGPAKINGTVYACVYILGFGRQGLYSDVRESDV